MAPLLILSLVLTLQSTPSESVTNSAGKTPQDSKVIVVEQGGSKILDRGPSVIVDSGSAEIAGDEASNVKDAKQDWASKCTAWENKLRNLNKENLMVVECGKPKLQEGMRQAEKFYTYESVGKYKIRVTGGRSR